MKHVLFILLFGVLLSYASISYSQKLTIGFLSGTNFSDAHGNFTTGKWQSKQGPVSGVFLSYSFNRLLAVQTELNYTTLYYDYQPYEYQYSEDYLTSPIYWQPINEKWDFSFYRIPLFVKLTTPTHLQFELAGGIYFSFLDNYDSNMSEYDTKPPKHDLGYFYSTGVSYPLNNNFRIYLNGRYISGRRNFIINHDSKIGAVELTLGIGYSGFFQKNNVTKPRSSYKDTSEHKVYIKYKGGWNISWNNGEQHNNSYSARNSFSTGISLVYQFDKNFALQTDMLFERKGYLMKDSSSSYFRYVPNENYTYYVDTKVDIDYIVIPLLLNVRFGNPFTLYFNSGPYVGIRLNARCTGVATYEYRSDYSYTLYKTIVYDDIEGYIENDDWGWIFGGGIQFPVFNRYKLDIEFRYNRGSKNIFNSLDSNQESWVNEDNNIKNESFNLMVGIQIPL